MTDIKDQIDAMLNAGVATESIATESPATESSSTEVPGTESPVTEMPGTETPSTEVPTTEVPVIDDRLKKIEDENTELRNKLAEFEAQKKKSSATKVPTTEEPFVEVKFIDDGVDLEDLLRDPVALNKLLNKVHEIGIKYGRKFQESTLRGIPDIVKNNVAIQATLKEKVTEFYENNKDLQGFKKVVSAVYEELAAENPDWKIDRIFDEVEKETRKRLELHKSVVKPTPTTEVPKGPKFPKTKTSRQRPKPKTSGLLDEIDAMNKL